MEVVTEILSVCHMLNHTSVTDMNFSNVHLFALSLLPLDPQVLFRFRVQLPHHSILSARGWERKRWRDSERESTKAEAHVGNSLQRLPQRSCSVPWLRGGRGDDMRDTEHGVWRANEQIERERERETQGRANHEVQTVN